MIPSLQRKALFLDRDGTIIEDVGDLATPTKVRLLPGALDALLRASTEFSLFIVTNQSGIARGTLTHSQVDAVNEHLVITLAEAGVPVERVFVCPHARADGCLCIKPKPHFLKIAEREHRICLLRSYSIGDHPHDVDFAEQVGGKGLYVLTGHGARHQNELQRPCPIFPDLAAAIDWLIGPPSTSLSGPPFR